jgi:hypothetical protein
MNDGRGISIALSQKMSSFFKNLKKTSKKTDTGKKPVQSYFVRPGGLHWVK